MLSIQSCTCICLGWLGGLDRELESERKEEQGQEDESKGRGEQDQGEWLIGVS